MFTTTEAAVLAAWFTPPAPHTVVHDGRRHDGGAAHAAYLAATHLVGLLADTDAPHSAAAGLERADAWTGHPTVPATAQRLVPPPPSATAWLGAGVWLHHQAASVPGAWFQGTVRHTLTVVAPCACGSVRETVCRDAFALATALEAAFAADQDCDGSCPRRDARLRHAASLAGLAPTLSRGSEGGGAR